MKLARKLILSMVIGLTVVLSANAYYRVRREMVAFDEDMKQDHQVLGRVLSGAVTSVWENSGREDAMRIVIAHAAPAAGMLHVRWIEEGDLRRRAIAEERLFTDVPISVAGQHKGYIEISESRHFQQEYARTTLIRSFVLTLLAVLSTGLFSTVIGIWFVGKPIQKLVDKARRIGAGDVEGPLVIRQQDEIGELAAEMNAMCLRLADARGALDAETEELLRTQEQLRHADRLVTVGKMASGIAHELGTPLGVALVRANMIASNESLSQDARDAARIVSEQIDRITHIVRQLLDFARGSGTSSPGGLRRRSPANLLAVARRAALMLHPLATKREVAIEVVSVEQPPEPPANEEQIEQVLVNLLVNAIHASVGPGKVIIDIGATEARPPADVTPVLWSEGAEPQYAVISVKDQGVGIPADVLTRIFEPFFTTKGVGEGTGLGLSVAYGMVREHGGWIEVSSEPGKGSRFSVYLPMEFAELV